LGQTLVEVTPEGEVAFEWSALDHYQRSDFVMDDMLIWDNTMLYDVIHANSIDVDSDGNYLVSIRHTSQVLKVDRQTGDVIWALGKNGDFTFIDDSANGFSHQHDAHWLENGHLLLFDNGNDYANPVSNVVEYEIDEQSLEVRLVWAYSTEDHHFAPNRGSAQRLPNGNTLINWVSRQPNIQEVTPEGELVLEITLPDNYASYQTQFWGK
jgi:outer membrane protein assembly factor BamB